MKKHFFATCFTTLLLIGATAQELPPPNGNCPPPMMGGAPGEPFMKPEFNKEMMQRRHEIVTLMQAYRIMPEEHRSALKTEILKRIKEDFESHREKAKESIEKMEKRIAEMKERVEAKDIDKIVEKEFERLLETSANMKKPNEWKSKKVMPPRPDMQCPSSGQPENMQCPPENMSCSPEMRKLNRSQPSKEGERGKMMKKKTADNVR